MATETPIVGLAELQKLLEQLPGKIEANVMRGALRSAQKVVLEDARSRINNVSGDLAASLRIKTSRRRGKVSARLVVGNKKAYYANMVEFGTLKHFIKARRAKSLFVAGLLKETVDHPGARAKPFMRPAADAAAVPGSRALEAMKDYLGKRINKELLKLPPEADS